ncbi:MAG: hypothetical protein PHX16_03525 [Syntrophaceticus sp.]|nr:hypothetical protein [Syntrophaceticus sp.]HBG16765.1 hypothetical protein [Bacillota bacterium]
MILKRKLPINQSAVHQDLLNGGRMNQVDFPESHLPHPSFLIKNNLSKQGRNYRKFREFPSNDIKWGISHEKPDT